MNRDLSKVLESLQNLEQNSASSEELSLLKDMMSLIVETGTAVIDEVAVITTALKEQNKLIDQKVDLNRDAIDQLYKYLMEKDTLGGRYIEIKKEKKNVNS
tara:strand:+ start:455 stop:757 length:303 start_codon:yes stop_codon:yes gene_type:complete